MTVARQQLVEIAKALSYNARVLSWTNRPRP
jgi:ABC-type sugar transport system ATPase subunit